MNTNKGPLDGVSERMLREDSDDQRRRERLAVNIQDPAATNPNRLTPEERYHRDPMFHALVDMFRGAIMNADYTPTEIREAAMLACIIVERYRPARPIFLDREPR